MLKRWRGERSFHAHETSRFDQLNGLPLASFKQRAFAYCLDFIIIAAVSSLLGGRFHHNDDGCSVNAWSMMKEVLERVKELAESVVYFAVMLKWMDGQTPGKKWMKILRRFAYAPWHGNGGSPSSARWDMERRCLKAGSVSFSVLPESESPVRSRPHR